jgi:hypothetical protein
VQSKKMFSIHLNVHPWKQKQRPPGQLTSAVSGSK